MQIKSLTVTHTKFFFLYKCTCALSHMPMCHIRVDSVVCNQKISCVNIADGVHALAYHRLHNHCIASHVPYMGRHLCQNSVIYIYIVVVCRVVEHQHCWHIVPRLCPCQVIGNDAAVHLQISTDYLRESCMTILQVTYR